MKILFDILIYPTIWACMFCWILAPVAATGSETCAQDQSDCFSLYIIDASLTDVFETIAEQSANRIEVAEDIRGRVKSLTLKGGFEDVVQAVSQSGSLEWFQFNGITYVSRADRAVSRVVRLGHLPYQSALASLEDAGLNKPPFSIRAASNNQAIVLTGPSKMVAFGEIVIESLPDPLSEPEIVVDTIRTRRGNVLTIEPIGGAVSKPNHSQNQDLADEKVE